MTIKPHQENSINYDASLFSLSKHMNEDGCSSLKSEVRLAMLKLSFPYSHDLMNQCNNFSLQLIGVKEYICPMPMADYLTIRYISKLLAQRFIIFIYSSSQLASVLKLL